MGRVASQFLNPGLAIGFGIEGGFEATDGRWAVLQHLSGPTHPFRFELFEGNDSIHEAHLQCLLRAIAPAQKPDLPGFALSHHPCQKS